MLPCASLLLDYLFTKRSWLTTKYIMSLLKDYTGKGMSARSNTSALKTMNSGIAKLAVVALHVKESTGSISVKMSYDALAPNQDGIDEYIRTSKATFLEKDIEKLKYLFDHSDNVEAKQAWAEMPSPFTEVLVDNANVIFQTNEELDAIRAVQGENIDFLWVDGDNDKKRFCVTVTDAKAYADALLNAVTLLIGEKYHLTITQANDKSNFARIKSIMKAKI